MNGFQALLTFLCVLAAADNDPLEKYTRGPGNAYHGRYTRDVHEPEFLIPRRVLEDGGFDTYALPNFYDRQEIDRRKKRSTETGDEGPEIDKLHLVLLLNGIDHHVELSPYHEFISPDMVVETRGSGLRTNLNEAVRFKRASDRQCHYRGFVRGHHGSRAALSLCDGVIGDRRGAVQGDLLRRRWWVEISSGVGYVQTNHGRYFIEPADQAEPEPDGQHVHIAYKRHAPRENKDNPDEQPKRHCGTSDNWEVAWAEQLAKRQKRLMEEQAAGGRNPAGLDKTHSIHRYIEIGLIVDRRFLDFHNNTNYEQYLLTIMNMVSDFYHDHSVGNQIDVVVVRMVYLEKEKEELDLLISPAAEETLDSFAKWAEKMNPKDHAHPNHFDIAVLVTRYDICSEGTNCELMGLAYVGTACDPKKAACINEDSGLLLGIVVAHEVGHVMGCSHDEIESSGCPSKDKDESFFLMSPIVFIFTIRWSTCSRKFMSAYLDSGLGECLNDDPRNPSEKFKYPNMLPGAMYGPDFQCEMSIPGSKACPKAPSGSCDKLWCLTNSSCFSRGIPMADGSKCGENKWCIHKNCVDMGSRPTAVHGGWGQWGPMGPCSRTCGGGLKQSERECDKPVPANGGRYCLGERRKLAMCNTVPCDPEEPTFRAAQCTSFNKKKVMADGLHTWTPFTEMQVDPCALFCINENKVYVKVSPMVNDSTPCKAGTNNICVAGTCKKVGCDWVLNSDAVEDKCGVCRGDGTKCKPVEGLFEAKYAGEQYAKIVTIPKGARSIHVYEVKAAPNTLAVRLEKNKTYCLNDNKREERDGDYGCAKATLVYVHPETDKEEIEIKGPIGEDIRIEYVFFSPTENPGVRYKYYVMSTEPGYTPKYIWDFMEWSDCSAKCGGGTAVSEATCIEENGGKVSPSFCEDTPRPDPKSRICNSSPCPAKWRVSQWSKCSACDGKNGLKHRKVQCVKPAARPGEDDVQANLDACKGRVPKQKEDCVGKRPCKTSCAKKTRNTNTELEIENEELSIPIEDQAKLIDKFVDQSLARYLGKSQGAPSEFEKRNDGGDFRQLLRDWSIVEEEKRKRATCPQNFTTPKPGSIVKDSIPIENVVLMQVPYFDENLQANLSDKAFRETGDRVGMSIDTSRQKTYNGTEALKMLEKLSNKETTPVPRNGKENSTFDQLASIVDQ